MTLSFRKVFGQFPEKFPKKEIEDFRWIKGQDVSFGSDGVTDSSMGPMPYIHMTAGDHRCIYFRKVFGQHLTDDTARHTKKILGYLCKMDGTPLTDSEISRFIQDLKVVKETPAKEA